jgi:hypothetical protein
MKQLSFFLLLFSLVFGLTGIPVADPSYAQEVSLAKISYRGWKDSWILSNAQVEVIVVPAIGRVMQMRFRGTPGSFWENSFLTGDSLVPADWWGNFGGDKVWPAPQTHWQKITGHDWPPPRAFDGHPFQAEVLDHGLRLISELDPQYGLRVKRTLHLDAKLPVMTIKTTFVQETEPLTKENVAIWIVTQLQDPVMIYGFLPVQSQFPNGYTTLLSSASPPSLHREGQTLSLTRDPVNSYKIGMDGHRLWWVGHDEILQIEAERIPDATYPDQNSSIEVYTTANPDAYVELECLGPLVSLKVGEETGLTLTYTLAKRIHK